MARILLHLFVRHEAKFYSLLSGLVLIKNIALRITDCVLAIDSYW